MSFNVNLFSASRTRLLVVLQVFWVYLSSARALPLISEIRKRATTDQGSTSITSSNDLWAQVIANVAPLMVLVGEKNAKEYMRTASSWPQFWCMSTAPLGIISIMISAIRLSGPEFLRRIMGRESERRSEAMVELTPLSVRPATAVYASGGVEIEPVYSRDRVAFVCGHATLPVGHAQDALDAFRTLYLPRRDGAIEEDRDFELILALWGNQLSLGEVADIAKRISRPEGPSPLPLPSPPPSPLPSPPTSPSPSSEPLRGREDHYPDVSTKPRGDRLATTTSTLSFRVAGVSPTQTAAGSHARIETFRQALDVVAGCVFLGLIAGVQLIGYFVTSPGGPAFPIENICSSLVGYTITVACTLALLLMIKQEVSCDIEAMPPCFREKAVWTFSDARHLLHRPMLAPTANALVTARPASFSPVALQARKMQTTVLTGLLTLGYVFFYLGMRVAPWWVPFSTVIIIWVGAAYRASTVRKHFVATGGEADGEHWIGLFRENASASVLNTLENSGPRPGSASVSVSSSSISGTDRSGDCILLAIPPYRATLHSWSGVEDVMKAGLALAQTRCRTWTSSMETVELPGTPWTRLVRFNLSLFVPGATWHSSRTIDLAISHDDSFTLEPLIRLLVKTLHMCIDQPGTVARHDVSPKEAAEISHVLCGPVANLPPSTVGDNISLRAFLATLRDLHPPGSPGAPGAALDQAVLLPTVMLATMYSRAGVEIQGLQSRHVDNLRLGSAEYLPTLDRVLDRAGVWERFTKPRDVLWKSQWVFTAPDGTEEVVPRGVDPLDQGSAYYKGYNMRDSFKEATRPVEEEGEIGKMSI
ncbi:hypothetical protein QBC39DRAFT_380561 [Podospora conica]|nr:hypothetical protein QBC39DRAFT_380561 [Schizothecium conicum]